ncbi:MAG: sigma-70 family RNA polymerase sigma factor [Chloroflexi bacterium]|nr:sigma-70 family RNA polymerase sigma factor [Chloroflexota bacterium]
MTETETIARAQAGEEEAWRALMQRYQQPVFRLAYLLIGDAAAAEDVAQETFTRAYRGLARFDSTRPLRPWLLQITRRTVYNRQRSLRRYAQALGRLFQQQRQTAPSAHEETEAQEQALHLWTAVQRLARSDQEVIYLRYFLELSVGESANALGVASGTVKSRSSRALTRLRQVIETEFPELASYG